MMKTDMWYGFSFDKVTGADCYFFSDDGKYRGNLYRGHEIIGDFSGDDSVEIERAFKAIGIDIFG